MPITNCESGRSVAIMDNMAREEMAETISLYGRIPMDQARRVFGYYKTNGAVQKDHTGHYYTVAKIFLDKEIIEDACKIS